MKKFKGTKGVIILAILVVLVITYYHYLSNRQQPDSKQEEVLAVMTPVQEVLSRNLETNYPATPREVVRYFSEITQCFYNEPYTEEELEARKNAPTQLSSEERLLALEKRNLELEEMLK